MIIFTFLLGCIFGSFYNVVIYRLPINQSIIFPNSHCPKCKYPIPFYFNIPILSFIFLNGKCYSCKIKISNIYPITELLTGLLWAFSFYNYSLEESIIFCLNTGILTCVSFIDFKTMKIPLSLLYLLLLVQIYVIVSNETYFHSLSGAISGAGFLSFNYLVTLFVFKKHGMGLGDIIILFILGLWLGPILILFSIFLSALIMLIVFLFFSIRRKTTYQKALPFVPSISISVVLVKIISPFFIF